MTVTGAGAGVGVVEGEAPVLGETVGVAVCEGVGVLVALMLAVSVLLVEGVGDMLAASAPRASGARI